jgi:2-hydroxy-6-oxo-6-(2'-aminophenyl)hexa-2,4-dienoate hydrolase
MSAWESRFVDAGGIRTHYLEAGSGEPLVLLHGGGSGADAYGNWKDCIPLLSPHFHVYAMDMVGFGRTQKPDPAGYVYSQQNRNAHLLAFLDALKLGTICLVGNSMGGATSLGVTMQAPARVRKLVLMGSAGIRTADQPSAAMKAIVDYDFTVEGMRRLITALTGPGYKPDEATVEYRHKLSVEPETRAALQAINGIVKQGGMLYADEDVRKVKVPTLVVNCKLDQVSTMSRGLRFLELLENSWGYFVPHAGHWVMIEAPADFCGAITTFFKGSAGR